MRYLEALKPFTYSGRAYKSGDWFLATERGARVLLAGKLVRELVEDEVEKHWDERGVMQRRVP